jgi:hypothetical protein
MDVIVDAVVSALTPLLSPATWPRGLKTINLGALADHGKVRFYVYGELSRFFRYKGMNEPQRVPLPILAEVLVKACFPGMGAASFTCFVPSVIEGLQTDRDKRAAEAASIDR